MSDVPQGEGWWQASDGKWYPPMPPPPPNPYGQQPYGYQQPYGQQPYGYQQHGYGYAYGPGSAYSGFWRRVAAALIDGLILSVPTSIIRLAASEGSTGAFVGYGITPGAGFAVSIISTLINAAYYAYLEGVRGQTIGKMALGIKVVDADDPSAVIGIGRGIGRYFARLLSGIVLGLGYLWMLWDDRKQCWHDKLVRSVVIRTP